jgi:hypothetical protein
MQEDFLKNSPFHKKMMEGEKDKASLEVRDDKDLEELHRTVGKTQEIANPHVGVRGEKVLRPEELNPNKLGEMLNSKDEDELLDDLEKAA